MPNIPTEFQSLLRERMDECKDTIIKKILPKTKVETILDTIAKNYAGEEMEQDYP